MTSVAQDADYNDYLYPRSAEDLYLKRDYSQFFTGLILGIILTLIGLYYYRGGFNFPRPVSVGSEEDRIDRPTPIRPSSRYGTLRVRGANVRMRSCPGFNCNEVALLQPGMRVSDLGQTDFIDNEEWIKVRAGSQEGWVSRFYLE